MSSPLIGLSETPKAPPRAGEGRKRGRPPTASREERRALIVREARRIFTERGYGAATTDQVAAACGMSKRTLYGVFPSKRDIFVAVVKDHRRSMLALPRPGEDASPEEALAAIFRADIGEEEERERFAFIRLTFMEARKYPELKEDLGRHGVEEARGLLADWLADQARRGTLAIDDPDSAARILMDMMFGAVVFKMEKESDWPVHASRARHLRQCIRIFLDGARPRREGGA